jgi:hypothetical protein
MEDPKEASMRARRFALAATLVLAAVPAAAQQPAPAGRIKVVSGSAFVVRGAAVLPAEVGQEVFEADRVRTGSDGRLGITLKDDTRFSLGPASEVHLSRFAYAPSQGRLALALNVVRGVAAYVSGRIAKLAPDAVRLEAPGAIVGVRGTTVAMSVSPR